MGKFETYLDALHDANYKPLCDDCMAIKMGYSQRQQANIFSRQARVGTNYNRDKAPCHKCGGKKYLTYCSDKKIKMKSPKEVKVNKPKILEKSLAASSSGNEILDLVEIGFEEIGFWKFDEDRLKLTLSKGQNFSPALYFFADGNEVLYVGKTTQKLSKRLYSYSRPGPTQSTNIRLNKLIKEQLHVGKTIAVYGYLHPQTVRIGRFELDYPAALESGIIKELQPIWNKR